MQYWPLRDIYKPTPVSLVFRTIYHDDVIKWKHFPRCWSFVRGIHRSPVNSPHKGQWRGALMFSLISVWINGWINNREAGDLRRYCAHYDITVMYKDIICGIMALESPMHHFYSLHDISNTTIILWNIQSKGILQLEKHEYAVQHIFKFPSIHTCSMRKLR